MLAGVAVDEVLETIERYDFQRLFEGVVWASHPGPRRGQMKIIALLLGILALSATAFAQMYKWVDKDGKTHYTDTPPPADTKALAPPRGGGTAPSRREDAAAGGGKSQGSFRPEEEVALRAVCVIYLLETLTCQNRLQRYCSLDELVKGIGGNPDSGLKRDPRNDSNYDYRVEVRADDVVISAIPRTDGLTGFFSTKDSGTRYNPKGAAGKGDKQIVGPQSCPDFK